MGSKSLTAKAFLISLIGVLALASACSSNSSIPITSPTTTTTPTTTPVSTVTTKTSTTTAAAITPIPGKPKTNQLTQDGVTLVITTDKETYVPGETVIVTASVQNTINDAITYSDANSGNPLPGVWIHDSAGTIGFELQEKEIGGIRTVFPMVSVGQLLPAQKKSREVVWNGKASAGNLGTQAPVGKYTIYCGVTLGNIEDKTSITKTVSCSVDIFIVGNAGWTTAEQAKNTALNLPDVAQWQADHSGAMVAKITDGNYFLTYNDIWQQVPANIVLNNLSFTQLQQAVPDYAMEYLDGSYVITLKSVYGMKPHMVKIWINAQTGVVSNKQFFDKAS